MRPIQLNFNTINGKIDACIKIVARDSCGQRVSWMDIISQNQTFKTCHATNGETNFLRVILRLNQFLLQALEYMHTSDHGHNIHNSRNLLKQISRRINYFRNTRDLNSYNLKFSMYEY